MRRATGRRWEMECEIEAERGRRALTNMGVQYDRVKIARGLM